MELAVVGALGGVALGLVCALCVERARGRRDRRRRRDEAKGMAERRRRQAGDWFLTTAIPAARAPAESSDELVVDLTETTVEDRAGRRGARS